MGTNAMGRESNKSGAAGAGRSGGQGGRSNADRDRDARSGMVGSKTGARSKDQMDAKTQKALADAFGTGNAPTKGMTGATGQASRSLDSQANERAVRSADSDALGSSGTVTEILGRALGVLSPIEEARPWDDPDYKPDEAGNLPSDANWKADIGEALGAAIGLGMGVPGVGTITGELNDLAGKPIPDVNLGPDVFGGGGGKAPPASGSDGEPKELVNDQFGQPTTPAAPPKPPAGPVGLPDIWDYPDEADLAASAPQDGLSDEERRRRGNTSIVVLGQGGLAI